MYGCDVLKCALLTFSFRNDVSVHSYTAENFNRVRRQGNNRDDTFQLILKGPQLMQCNT